MPPYFLAFSIIFCVLATAQAQPASIGRWSFDEGAGTQVFDSSGFASTGTLNGAAWTTGKIRNGLGLDGNDYVLMGSTVGLVYTAELSIAVWIYKRADCLTTACFIVHRAKGGGPLDLLALSYDGSPADNYLFEVSTGAGATQSIGLVGGSSAGDQDSWVHLAGTYDSTAIRLYRNGVQIASAATNGQTVYNDSTPIVIGANTDNGGGAYSHFVNAVVDEPSAYNVALTSTQVQALYQAGLDSNAAPGSRTLSQLNFSSASVTFAANGADSYIVEASTASDFTGTIFSSATTSQSALALSVPNLSFNTTYYFRVGGLWGSFTTYYGATAPSFGVTRATSPAALAISAISASGFTLDWSLNNPPGSSYELTLSNAIDFSVLTASQTTTLGQRIFTGLSADSTYYARVRAVSHAGVPTDFVLAAVITTVPPAGGIITVSANRLPAVWYNGQSTFFNAQGASQYRYILSANPTETFGGSEPFFSGSALTIDVPEGVYYMHVRGVGGAGDGGQTRFGPVQVDLTAPVVASVSAQESLTNPSPIPDGGATISATPRFGWPQPASASPVLGYGISVSSDPSAQPPQAVLTTLLVIDLPLTYQGVNYVKVRALDLAGNWGPAAGMSLTFTQIPSNDRVIVKNNRFNPLRGGCMQLEVQAASGGKVRIELFTLNGQRVATLSNAEVAAGLYSYSWCGRNAANEIVATGAYIMRVEAPGHRKDYLVGVVK